MRCKTLNNPTPSRCIYLFIYCTKHLTGYGESMGYLWVVIMCKVLGDWLIDSWRLNDVWIGGQLKRHACLCFAPTTFCCYSAAMNNGNWTDLKGPSEPSPLVDGVHLLLDALAVDVAVGDQAAPPLHHAHDLVLVGVHGGAEVLLPLDGGLRPLERGRHLRVGQDVLLLTAQPGSALLWDGALWGCSTGC